MKLQTYQLKKDEISLFKPKTMVEIEKDIEQIFRDNKKILPKNKRAKILVKPNLNNDLNGLTGNSTDLRIIVSILEALKKRKYENVILGDGPNCGINHIGIDVFGRLGLKDIAKKYDVQLINLNETEYKKVQLTTSVGRISRLCIDADFIINVPKIKTHLEAGLTISCKNYMGCFLGTDKRSMHENLAANIVRLNEIIKTDLIIIDGLVGMEGNGPGDGIPKEIGIILSGHNPYVVDLLCCKLIGLNYKKMNFLKIAVKKGHISKEDINNTEKIEPIVKFVPARKNIFAWILLRNFFIKIRFMKAFQKMFDSGLVPWMLFKMKVRQDVYIHEEKDIKNLQEKNNLTKEQKEMISECLEYYCPMKLKTVGEKDCIKCMYCYQVSPGLVSYEGDLNAFKMQIDRFGNPIIKNK